MAKATTAPAPTHQLNTWKERLDKFAKRATASTANNISGKTISTKGGKFAIDGVKTDEFVGVILDVAVVKAYYDNAYDPANPQPPSCYAISRDGADMTPHAKVKDPLCKSCSECRWNKFGTATLGKGKACKDTLRLHILKIEDADQKIVEPYVLSIPPTGLKAASTYLKGVEDLGLCPQVVATRFRIEQDDSTFFQISFEVDEELDEATGGKFLDHADRAGDNVLAHFSEREAGDAPAPTPRVPNAKIKGTPVKPAAPVKRGR
jgi:hypothetical protein